LQALDLALMTERYARLERTHDLWRRRLKLGRAMRWGLRGAILGLAGGLAISVAATFAQALAPEAYLRLLILGLGLGGALAAALALAWPQPPLTTARQLDGQLGLQERLSTAVELRRRGWAGSGPMARLQLEDTLQAFQGSEPRAALPVRLDRRDLLIAALLLLTSLLAMQLGRPAFEAAERQQAIDRAVDAEAARIEALRGEIAEMERLSPERREALIQPLQTLEQQMADAHSPELALAALSAGERELRELARPQPRVLTDTLQATGELLSRAPDQDLAALGAQLAQGDLQAAVETLRQMDLLPSSAAHAESQARQLEAAAETLQAAMPELAQALREAAASLRHGDSVASRQNLASAARALEDVSQQVLQAEMAASVAEALAQAQGRLLRATGETTEAGEVAAQGQSGSQSRLGGGQPDGAGASQGQTGSNSSIGQGEGGGAGRGENAAGVTQGSTSGNAPIAQGNAPGDGGERPYQPLQPPARLAGESGIELALAGSGDAGELVLGVAGSAPGAEGAAQVPYTAVFGRYEAAVRMAIDNLQPPAFMEALVRQYFSSLAP